MSEDHGGGHDEHGGGHGHEEAHQVDDRIRQLPSIFHLEETVLAHGGEETIQVNDTVSTAASMYEKLRNTLEYEEEHVLRRNAIRRVLKRRIGVDIDAATLSKDLLTELVWARYLPNNAMPLRLIDEVAGLLHKYNPLIQASEHARDPNAAYMWILDLMATEIEQHLVPPKREDAFAGFMFRTISHHIEWKKGSLPEDQRELQLYLAVYRTLLRADTARLRFRVFSLYHPEWKGGTVVQAEPIAGRLDEVISTVDGQVNHPIAELLSRSVRKYAVLFNVLFDVAAKTGDDFLDLAADRPKLDSAVGKAAAERINTFKHRQQRRVFRAVAFLFLTKMILALAVEFPYDTLISHTTSLLPIGVNVLFPPLLLAVIGLSNNVAPSKHVKNIQKGVRSIVYGSHDMNMVFKVKKPLAPSLAFMFGALYVGTTLVTYGIICSLLIAFGFNLVSALIFLLFLSVVTFFGLRIRQLAKEVVVEGSKPSILGSIVDVFTLPIIRAGRWISIRTPRINVFLFFMDFIIEAPFKMAIELIESWLAFVREKKEEI